MVIYKITNKTNGKCYIGQTTQQLQKRLLMHFTENVNTNVSYIRRAIQKHGKDSFSVGVIGEYQTIDQLNDAEEFFIDFHNCLAPNGYNLTAGGCNRMISEITRKKLSESHKGLKYPNKKKRTKPAWNKGIPKLPHTGFQKGHKSYAVHRKQAVICSNGKTYASITEAAKELETSSGKICAVIKGTRNHTKGFTFKKVSNV